MPQDRSSPSGPVTSLKSQVVIQHAPIAIDITLEATVALANAVVGDVVALSPTAALPAGLALSHGRVTTAGVIAIGLANVTAATITPAAVTYDVTSQRR